MAKKPTTPRKAPAKPRPKAAPAKKAPAKKKAGTGTPKGKAAIAQPHGGAIGNPPFVPTAEMRQRVRSLAQAFPDHSQQYIAAQVGISRSTLHRHFRDDMVVGRGSMLAAVATQLIQRALKGDDAVDAEGRPLAPGNLDAQKFILARLGGWTTKVEMTGKDGAAIEVHNTDLTRLSDEELAAYGRLAAVAEGKDPDEVVSGGGA